MVDRARNILLKEAIGKQLWERKAKGDEQVLGTVEKIRYSQNGLSKSIAVIAAPSWQ